MTCNAVQDEHLHAVADPPGQHQAQHHLLQAVPGDCGEAASQVCGEGEVSEAVTAYTIVNYSSLEGQKVIIQNNICPYLGHSHSQCKR